MSVGSALLYCKTFKFLTLFVALVKRVARNLQWGGGFFEGWKQQQTI